MDSIRNSKRTHPTVETDHLATMEAYSVVSVIESKGLRVCTEKAECETIPICQADVKGGSFIMAKCSWQ